MPRPVLIALTLLGSWVVACELKALGMGWLPVGPVKWLHIVVAGTACVLCVARVVIRRDERVAWILLGLGPTAWVTGETYFTAVLWDESSPPVPSWADAGYLAMPPLVFAGLVVLMRSRTRGMPKTLWVDGITAGLAAAAVNAAFVFKSVLEALSGDAAAVMTNLSYPVLDLLLLGLISGVLATTGWRVDRTFGLLAIGVLAYWIADTVFLVQTAHGTWMSGGVYDQGWWMMTVLFAAAAWSRPVHRPDARRQRGLIAVPIVFALVGLLVLIAATLAQVSVLAVIFASCALLTVLTRLAMTFREHAAMLRHSQDEALTDPLTGLGNRRALSLALTARMDAEPPTPLTLALFDLDGFKAYNDSFGHAAGDALLQRMAAALTAILGDDGTTFRMGGDEFCVLLPAGDEGDVLLSAASAVLVDQGDGFSIGASFGAVRMPDETMDPGHALKLADQRMYANKQGAHRSGTAQQVKVALLSALSQRDPEIADHGRSVGSLTEQTARALGCLEHTVVRILLAAELHDVGKMAIPEAILATTGALNDEEWAVIRQHTVAGERIVASAPALADIAPLVRASHERWDGTGYPDGLAGTDIPHGARIIAVCNAFHAMTTDRPYRRAMSDEVAVAELEANAGTQFDPEVVRAFLSIHHAACARQAARTP
jgi:two-component system, cell cycle response regulator